jgi:hypothetical protein
LTPSLPSTDGRGDLFEKRRQLAEAWAQYCDGEEPAESKVVRLAGRAG